MDNKENRYDVIVAGSGMAGALAAATAAKDGAKVLLLDRNDRKEVGKKTNWGWVCGDAVATNHLNFVKSMVGLTFDRPALDQKVAGVIAYSPDLKSKFPFEGDGYILNRPIFESELLEYALRHGVQYEPKFEVEQPIIEDNYVVGIKGKNARTEHVEYRAKIVIDALGVATTIRRKLPHNEYVDGVVDVDDLETTGRYLYEFDLDHEDLTYYDSKNALIHLNQEIAPGGYGWVFPKSGNRVNIGLGVQQRSLEMRNAKLNKKDNLHSLMEAYAKMLPVFKQLRPFTEGNGSNGYKGYWSVAVRHQMESLVYNGYMGAGDSMAMPNPISAGGIGPSLVAGILAGKNAAAAIKEGDVSLKGLWKYNLDFNEHYGNKTAGLEVFRIYLQSLNNDVLNYGMRNFLTTKEATDLSYGNVPELSVVSKAKMLLKGATNVNAFTNLVRAVNMMKGLNETYRHYPQDYKTFTPWKAKVQMQIEEVKKRFPPHPI